MRGKTLRVAVVTNIPAPYRVVVYDKVACNFDIEFHAFYSAESEPDRHWNLPEFVHAHTFLKKRMLTRNGRFIHNNPDIWGHLRAFKPDVVVTTGYNPTQLYAFAYSMMYGVQHVPMTDGTDVSEANLSAVHRVLRHYVLRRSRAFIAASNGGRRLFQQYGVLDHRVFFSPLCANTAVDWSIEGATADKVDFIFSGRLVATKNPSFFLEVAQRVSKIMRRQIKVVILGSGPLIDQLKFDANAMRKDVDVVFAGYVDQSSIPVWFKSSKIFLFPTKFDPWGVVANEACLAGLPVITSQYAGVANELVIDRVNGYVLKLDADLWAEKAANLLQDESLYQSMATQSIQLVRRYSFENAAKGIVAAARMAVAPHVLCVQRRLTYYRVPFFERLRTVLAQDGVEFDLAYGQPTAEESTKNDAGSISWAHFVPNRYFFDKLLCWQHPKRLAKNVDLLILTQENKLIFNLWALLSGMSKRLAYWGHGRNFQSERNDSIRERFKQWTARHADWWFAYTALSVDAVRVAGVPFERISNLENSVDTTELANQCASIEAGEVDDLRARLGLSGATVGVFIGSLYREKSIPFLLRAAKEIAERVPGFVLVIAGDGPERRLIDEVIPNASWLRYVGVIEGADKATLLMTASVFLNPGMVGLGILDAFVAGIPFVTTDCGKHSPEIAYLRNNENGLLTPADLDSFVRAVVNLLNDQHLLAKLRAGALQDAGHYTIENMVQNFRRGVNMALQLPARR